MKPIFTNRGQPLTQILPDWCAPLARCLSPQPEPKVYLYEVFLICPVFGPFFLGGGGFASPLSVTDIHPLPVTIKLHPRSLPFNLRLFWQI